ncbi:MAG: hypothetical protein ACRDSG_16385 [Pseudonocardiaceae bacterium]
MSTAYDEHRKMLADACAQAGLNDAGAQAAVRALDGVQQPLEITGRAVTFWEELPPHRHGTPPRSPTPCGDFTACRSRPSSPSPHWRRLPGSRSASTPPPPPGPQPTGPGCATT